MPISSVARGPNLLVTIDRPPVNALDLETIEALRKTFAAVAAAPPAGGVVLTGAGERALVSIRGSSQATTSSSAARWCWGSPA